MATDACRSSWMNTYALLGELVDTLFGRGTTTLDHIKDALLVRHQADDLTHHLADKVGLLASTLLYHKRKVNTMLDCLSRSDGPMQTSAIAVCKRSHFA